MSISKTARSMLIVLGTTLVFGGCVTVKPQERTVLADPSMQFDTQGGAKTKHALENREGSYGGNGVTGGGCGCN